MLTKPQTITPNNPYYNKLKGGSIVGVLATQTPDVSTGAVLTQVAQMDNARELTKADGYITEGVIIAKQVTGGQSWAISDYIEFGYKYIGRPYFTWGLDGTAELSETDEGWSAGDNSFTKELPATLANLSEQMEAYQPAIFIPRVIHWHKSGATFYGCYLLICQVNSLCTEVDKDIRVHYRFEGRGVSQTSSGSSGGGTTPAPETPNGGTQVSTDNPPGSPPGWKPGDTWGYI
jgi:hypothetical protein